MDKEPKHDALKAFVSKTNLEQAMAVGLHGVPEMKPEEKSHYLGEFQERILKLLTKEQVMEDKVYQEIIDALKDKRSTKILIHGDIAFHHRHKYQRIAHQFGKPYTLVHESGLTGNVGLVVAGDRAVDVTNPSPH